MDFKRCLNCFLFSLFFFFFLNSQSGLRSLYEPRRAFWFKYELINIQTQIHRNKFSSNILFLLLFLLLVLLFVVAAVPLFSFLWIYLLITCLHYSVPTFTAIVQHFVQTILWKKRENKKYDIHFSHAVNLSWGNVHCATAVLIQTNKNWKKKKREK